MRKKASIKIHVFGNPLLPFDNLALKLLPRLKKKFKKIEFLVTDPNENLKPSAKKLIIIDAVKDIKKITVIANLNRLSIDKMYSLHDFDLGFNLKLLQKMGRLKKILIFGLPMKIKNEEKTYQDLIKKMTEHFF